MIPFRRLATACAMVLLAACTDDAPGCPGSFLGFYELRSRNGTSVPAVVDIPDGPDARVTSINSGAFELGNSGYQLTLALAVTPSDGSSSHTTSRVMGSGSLNFSGDNVTMTLASGSAATGSFGGDCGTRFTLSMAEPWGTLVFLKVAARQ